MVNAALASANPGLASSRGRRRDERCQPDRLRPFPPEYRASGVLLHVTSLPSPYGIGDLGPAALAWIDRLHEAGQSWWQALPLGPDGIRQLAISVAVVVCRQRAADQPGRPDRGRIAAPSDCEGSAFSGR